MAAEFGPAFDGASAKPTTNATNLWTRMPVAVMNDSRSDNYGCCPAQMDMLSEDPTGMPASSFTFSVAVRSLVNQQLPPGWRGGEGKRLIEAHGNTRARGRHKCPPPPLQFTPGQGVFNGT